MKTTILQDPKSDCDSFVDENLTPNQRKTLKPRYTLVQLLEGADEMVLHSKEAAAWIDMPPVGKEVF
jgi:hypothetical protein